MLSSHPIATLSNLDMQQCPKILCNFVQKVLAKNTYGVSPIYSEDFFSITYHYPHSTFYFYNTYDYEGNLLKEKFQADFEDIILYYTFAYKLKKDIDIDCITDEQIDLYNKLAEIRNDGNSDFKSKLEKSLKILKEADSLNTKEVKKYLRIIALLNKYSIVNLSLAMLNIMVINQSGEFGRKNNFCSLKNSKIIDRMGKVYGKEFEKILTDINLFWINTKIFYMAEHSKKKR